MQTQDNTQDVSNAKFWQQRYDEGEIGWDMGRVSPPLQAYIEHLIKQNVDKNSAILIPGAGHAYEASYLHSQGFSQVTILDFAAQPLQKFAQANPDFPKNHLLQADFFDLDALQYQFDFIIEQTFFCAIDPARREAYAKRMQQLLKSTGELFGVLFNRNFDVSPPFGGSQEVYRDLFSRYFDIVTLEPCYNSIRPRQGSEVFIRLKKRQTD